MATDWSILTNMKNMTSFSPKRCFQIFWSSSEVFDLFACKIISWYQTSWILFVSNFQVIASCLCIQSSWVIYPSRKSPLIIDAVHGKSYCHKFVCFFHRTSWLFQSINGQSSDSCKEIFTDFKCISMISVDLNEYTLRERRRKRRKELATICVRMLQVIRSFFEF